MLISIEKSIELCEIYVEDEQFLSLNGIWFDKENKRIIIKPQSFSINDVDIDTLLNIIDINECNCSQLALIRYGSNSYRLECRDA